MKNKRVLRRLEFLLTEEELNRKIDTKKLGCIEARFGKKYDSLVIPGEFVLCSEAHTEEVNDDEVENMVFVGLRNAIECLQEIKRSIGGEEQDKSHLKEEPHVPDVSLWMSNKHGKIRHASDGHKLTFCGKKIKKSKWRLAGIGKYDDVNCSICRAIMMRRK